MNLFTVQSDPVWQDKTASHDRVRRLLESAPIPPQSLIVLPEMFDTGFSMNVSKTAQTASLESERFLQELAARFDSAVMAGVVGPAVNGIASNISLTVAPDGGDLCRYQKMQPFTLTGEHKYYGAGEAVQVFEWQDVMISPFVCYDLRFPELFRPAAVSGAELFVVIACWPTARSEHWVRLLQARAIENQSFVVGVNRCGSDPQFEYDGRSAAFDPLGGCRFECDSSEQVKHIKIEVDEARSWRKKFPALRDIRQ